MTYALMKLWKDVTEDQKRETTSKSEKDESKKVYQKVVFEIGPGNGTEFHKSNSWGQSLQIKEINSTKSKW